MTAGTEALHGEAGQRMRQRHLRCGDCGKLVHVEANLDSGRIRCGIPETCPHPPECADEYCKGILERPFAQEGDPCASSEQQSP